MAGESLAELQALKRQHIAAQDWEAASAVKKKIDALQRGEVDPTTATELSRLEALKAKHVAAEEWAQAAEVKAQISALKGDGNLTKVQSGVKTKLSKKVVGQIKEGLSPPSSPTNLSRSRRVSGEGGSRRTRRPADSAGADHATPSKVKGPRSRPGTPEGARRKKSSGMMAVGTVLEGMVDKPEKEGSSKDASPASSPELPAAQDGGKNPGLDPISLSEPAEDLSAEKPKPRAMKRPGLPLSYKPKDPVEEAKTELMDALARSADPMDSAPQVRALVGLMDVQDERDAELLENYVQAAIYYRQTNPSRHLTCLLYTSDAADEEDSVDLGGRRIIKKKKK
eukprot:TRINITY_DN19429_c0_g1_i2.p1 TRINITY_DN19429_c0_g1~~TRINITY_DN19429_c0_g1_i2.p1  ORF type:complete len:339 (+),score=115.43 TRINITY_DN19429_c0_g1_i2:194-1210(+)